MATYSTTTWATLKSRLSERLGDTGKVFWVDAELEVYLDETFRIFGLLSAFWRATASFNTSANTRFYNLASSLSTELGYTVTDRDMILIMQYHLLEVASSQSSWSGTNMFTLDDFRYALQRRRDQFLADTGCVVTHSDISVDPAPSDGRVNLAETIIDVRRCAWHDDTDFSYTQMWREDELSFTAADRNWNTQAGVKPYSFSVIGEPPIELQMSPNYSGTGDISAVIVSTGATLNPASSATILGIPDDMTWIVKWGALADLLSQEGQARDPERAAFCEERYQFGVALAKRPPVVIHASIAGTPIVPDSLANQDSAQPGWEGASTSTPTTMGIAGLNLVAFNPVPSGTTAIQLDVVQKAQIPTSDGANTQIGQEQLNGIIDYAEHLASFKMGGAEFKATQRQAENFIKVALNYSKRFGADARQLEAILAHSTAELDARPREIAQQEEVA